MPLRSARSRRIAMQSACAVAISVCAAAANATVTLNKISSTDWSISNGNITAVFDPGSEDITSVQLGSGSNASPNLLSELDQEFAGTPFGAGTQTFNSQVGPNGSYVDVWTTVASAGSAQASGGAYINPITYAFHYVIFANDPTIYCYEVLNHSATDPATSVGQGQFLFRSNPTLFPNLYQINTGPNQLGTANAVTTLNVPSTNSSWGTVSAQAGRTVQNAATDLTGSGIPGDNGTNFFTKYDYSIYTQFFQAETMYGSQYAVTEVDPSTDSLTGGPTKQELAWTDPGILNMEFLSDHYGIDGTGAGAFPGYAYYPTQGVATTKLYGPYGFTISSTTGTTAAQINQNAINSIPAQQAEFNTDAELNSSGYVNTTTRGMVQISVSNSAGWSSNTSNNTVVLSEPGVNFQESTQGSQYWGQLSQSGAVSIGNVTPGTYRLSIYELGQWGETRVDGVQVNGNTITIPQNLKFTPENFGTAAPIWTIGTPNRSANEFLDGHNTSGGDIREFYGAYDYWAQEAALGNPGKVVYYATAVGSIPATNNPAKWIANQWQKFDPGLYDASNGTSDNYNNTAPAYVTAGGGPAAYTGLPWEIHFTTTAAQDAQGQYVVLSVALAAAEGSLTIALNGHSETWHVSNQSDPMIRSGQAGFYQWLAYQYPTSDLNAVGTDNVFTLSTSQTDGDMYDALRMEITNTSAAPSVTGWTDYNYITGANSQIAPNDAAASTASNSFNASSQWAGSGGGSWTASTNWTNYIIPAMANDVATFGNTITANSTITLDGNRTVGSIVFNSPSQSYTIAAGTSGILTLSQTGGTASVIDLSGSHAITAPITLASSTQISVANAGTALTISNTMNGSGNVTVTGAGTVILSGNDSYNGSTSVLSGTLTIAYGGSIISPTLNISSGATANINGTVSPTTAISGAGSTVFGAGTGSGILQRDIGSLNLTAGSLVTVATSSSPGNRTVLVTNGLTFAGSANSSQGRLNLTDNDMIIVGGNLANVTSELEEGYNGGAWNGAGGIFSSSAAGNIAHLTALGSGYSIVTSFDGVTTASSDVLIKYTYYGDATLDGTVDGSDYSRIDNGDLNHLTGWSNGDFNYDAVINGSDYTLIDNAYNTQGAAIASAVASPTAAVAENAAAVPEPLSGLPLIAAFSGLSRRRAQR